MSAPGTLLTFESVDKVFPSPRGPVTVLRGVNAAIRAGEFVAVTGPSGSGKTTFLNLAALLDRPTSGRVRFRGEDTSRLGEPRLRELRKRHVGMVFQGFHLLPRRSVLENVLFRFRYLDTPLAEARALATGALATVGLSALAGQPARLLSGGEMQRVAIARAIAMPPDLLLVDEPTGNLDAGAAAAVMECFRALNRGGLTIVLATHNAALLAYAGRRLHCRAGALAEAPANPEAPALCPATA